MSADLDVEGLRSALAGCRIGREIIVLRETASTNDFVFRMAVPGVAEGLVVFAEHQTAGRGQRSHRWESASHKGLWFSILLRPNVSLSESARLTNWAAHTIAETIREELDLRATVKPPNDVYVDDRKVAGVLVEMRTVSGGDYLAIAGIGVNMNQTSEDFSPEIRAQAASLGTIGGRQIDRQLFCVALLRNLDSSYAKLFSK